MIAAVDPKPEETIVEIGPGRGAITDQLVRSGASVIAIELDHDLSSMLMERFKDDRNFALVQGDVLQVDLELSLVSDQKSDGVSRQSKLVANLPYYISTAVLQRLVVHRHLFSKLVLMFQREVVERITATPGDSERGYLTVIAQGAFRIENLFDVPASAFVPRPKVRSSVVKLHPKPANGFDDEPFRALLSASFTHKRKTLSNNLRAAYSKYNEILGAAEIDPQRRAESLALEEWSRLKDAVDRF